MSKSSATIGKVLVILLIGLILSVVVFIYYKWGNINISGCEEKLGDKIIRDISIQRVVYGLIWSMLVGGYVLWLLVEKFLWWLVGRKYLELCKIGNDKKVVRNWFLSALIWFISESRNYKEAYRKYCRQSDNSNIGTHLPNTNEKKLPFPYALTFWLAILERFFLTTALIFGFPGWLPIWLALKVASARGKASEPINYNLFLIGNLLSMLFGIIGAYVILGEMPSLYLIARIR